MSKFKIIFPIITVLVIMLTAGVLLSRQLDPRLEQVVFANTPIVEQVNVDADTEPVVESELSPTVSVSADQVSTTNSNSASAFIGEVDSSTNTELMVVSEEVTPTITPETALEDRDEIRSNTATATSVMVQIFKPQGSIICPVTATSSVSVHTIMQQAAEQCDFSYAGKDYPGLGFFVEQIDQVEQDKAQGLYWVYRVNGVKASLGVSQQTIAPGDTITWSYEAEY